MSLGVLLVGHVGLVDVCLVALSVVDALSLVVVGTLDAVLTVVVVLSVEST